MIKNIFLGLSLFIGSTVFAQQSTASPYSFYGIGDVNFGGTNEYKAMGGLSIYSDSIHLNLKNPASYSKLRLTTFSLGGTYKTTTFKTNDKSENAQRTKIDYLAVGIPLGNKLGASFGILPYSSVGYKISNTIKENDMTRAREFNGEGGLNKAFAGIGYAILPNLEIGADFGYNFGDIDNSAVSFISDDGSGFFIPKGTRLLTNSRYDGFTFNTGINYTRKLKGYDWNISATYSPETKLKEDASKKLETVTISSLGNIIPNEVREISNSSRNITMPSKIGFGTGIGKAQKWYIGAEITHTENSKLSSNWQNTGSARFEDSQRYVIGGFYIPKYNSYTSYLDRVVYRAGFRYENTGIILDNQAINDYAISLGAGFPVGRNLSNINISLEYGQKGKNTNTLIKENYFNLSVGISLNDLWFVKRRFE